MKVNITLFAGLRDVIGAGKLTLDLADGATVAQLRDRLSRDYPNVTPYLPTLVFAVEDDYVEENHPLREGIDIALIPPVSGGAKDMIEVTSDPLDPGKLAAAVRKDESGAVIVFSGVARNNSEGRRVEALEYEAHATLAEKKLREVAGEVRSRWPVTGVAIAHRVGRLTIGETSLLVAVSSPHRREAFEACQYAVDRIKQTVPVWKKEIWEGGGGAWVEGHPVETPDGVGTSSGS
jgi:molybdopterin synthase catalytic subunit